MMRACAISLRFYMAITPSRPAPSLIDHHLLFGARLYTYTTADLFRLPYSPHAAPPLSCSYTSANACVLCAVSRMFFLSCPG